MRRSLTYDALLAIATNYIRSASGVDDVGDDTPSLAINSLFSEEFLAFKERADGYEAEYNAEETALYRLIEVCVDFGVKLGAVTAGKLPFEAVPAVAELLDELRRELEGESKA